MKKLLSVAHSLAEIPNAFVMRALYSEEMHDFYYDGTMQVRMGDPYVSPIRNISKACKNLTNGSKFLLMGHRGSGKSTELNNMALNLEHDGYRVLTVHCASDLDLNNPLFEDVLILMGNALLKLAAELHCELAPWVIETLTTFWREGEKEITQLVEEEAAAELGISVSTPSVFKKLLSFTVGARKAIKYGDENKTFFRERISRRLSDWTRALNGTADAIAQVLEDRYPIIIFEDLDKLDIQDGWELFLNHAKALTDVTFPVIYTFPIALSYISKFGNLTDDSYTPVTFPMIKLKYMDGRLCPEGYETIRRIVEKRADMALFDENALTLMIEKTGGSLRDLFRVIIRAATRADMRQSERVELEDAERALEYIQTELTRMIEERHYPFLVEICKGKHEKIKDREMLLEMLEAHVVLEYNGKRWQDVHPLVADFLAEQGELNQDE